MHLADVLDTFEVKLEGVLASVAEHDVSPLLGTIVGVRLPCRPGR